MRERPKVRRPPVLLVAGPVLVRTLGIAGIPLIVAASDATAPEFYSRYCNSRQILAARDQPEALLRDLIAAGDQLVARFGQRLPLMYGDDFMLELVCAHRRLLAERYLFLLPDPDVASALLAKDCFQEFARVRQLPVPRGLCWQELADCGSPVLVKPRSKSDWKHSALRECLFTGDSKAIVLASGCEAARQPLIARHRDKLLFQEYIPGDDRQLWSYHGYADEQGRVLAAFLGRKLRTSPPLTGESSFIELMHDEARTAFGRQLVERLPLKGPFKLDFKTDSRTGTHALLEVNARFNLWHYLGAVNGINLMQVAYDHLLGARPPGPRPYTTTRRWIYLRYDVRAYRALAARGELSLAGWITSILSSRTVYNLFAWNDPMPLLMSWVQRLFVRARRVPGLVVQVLKRWRSTAS
ncbi:MAG: hypothetical protein EPO25_14410 [Gammaproteobacteria bacterium]|nr:MAG: hypothetical protein EPO25_14410 [Gammaproteobacteria bacterium]